MSAEFSPKVTQKTFRVDSLDAAVTLRRLRAMDKIEVGLQQSLLLRGHKIDMLNGEAVDLSYMIATLRVALVEPRDFPFDELDDDGFIQLWKEWDEFSKSFRKPEPGTVESAG